MSRFQILCVTMYQNDFSKIKEMNIHSDVIFANQANTTSYTEMEFDGYLAKMITTTTRGVGKNRNIALTYANGDICLLADDDVIYRDDMENMILKEFEKHSEADIMIFCLETNSELRKQKFYSKTRKHRQFERMPWGACRIAFRLNVIKKANLCFTTLFGGGCIFPSGEDSMWLLDAKRKGLKIYVSKEIIGEVSFDNSTWFSGFDVNYFLGKGAFYEAVHPYTKCVWMLYISLRTKGELTLREKYKVMKLGSKKYKELH